MDETLCLKSQLLFDEPEKNVVFFFLQPKYCQKDIHICMLSGCLEEKLLQALLM